MSANSATTKSFPAAGEDVSRAASKLASGDSHESQDVQAAEGSSGNVPENGGERSSGKQKEQPWYPRYKADFDLIRREHPQDYPVLAAIYDVLLREAHKEQSLSVTLKDEIIADRIGFSMNSRTKILKRKPLFEEMGLAKVPTPDRQKNSKKHQPTTWELTPSGKPWLKPETKKAVCPKRHTANKKPCAPKRTKNDANEAHTPILLTESKDIRKGSRKNLNSEKAACANAPLSDSTKEKAEAPFGPDEFFAGVDS